MKKTIKIRRNILNHSDNFHYPTGKKYLDNGNKGQVVILTTLFFIVITGAVISAVSVPTANQIESSRNALRSKQSYLLADTALEDIVYRLKKGKPISSPEVLSLNGGSVTATIADTSYGKQIISTANVNNQIRKMQSGLVLGDGISFHYGVQAGAGGFSLSNSSSVTGNIHSSGPIVGSGNYIYGDAISAGPTGSIKGVHITGSAFSHTLGDSSVATQVDGDAYYTTVASNVTVGGTGFPNSADEATSTLPISDEQINEWESFAVAGGTMLSSFCDTYNSSSNTCTLSSSKSIGPIKIPFNLLIKSSSAVITVGGPVWVTGNITTQTGPTVKMASSLGSTNVAVIADDPSNRTTGSVIEIGQSTLFQGSGSAGSYVFLISQNNSAETGGSNDAVTLSQGASALVAYASHGQITLSQSVSVKEATAYKINLTQSANVTYDTGLPSTLFAAGPSGGYDILNWGESE